eukprot:716271_1
MGCIRFLFLLSFVGIIHTEHTISSSSIASNTITCDQGDDCIVDVDCIDCSYIYINCESGYGCVINCRSDVYGRAIVINAYQVTNFGLNCDQSTACCRNTVIEASLSNIDSQFMLNCVGQDQCKSLTASISHVQSVYQGPPAAIYSVIINCQGSGSCFALDINAEVNVHFIANCSFIMQCM